MLVGSWFLIGLSCSILIGAHVLPAHDSSEILSHVTPGTVATTNRTVTTQELQSLVNEMILSEIPLLNAISDSGVETSYQINVQNLEQNTDYAQQSFFSTEPNLTPLLINNYSKFMALFDNYEPKLGVNEDKTVHEDNEENAFLNDYLGSSSGHKLYNFLQQKGYVNSKSNLKSIMKKIWFEQYSRTNGFIDSSGFEHVFLGELKTNGRDVSGLHSWIQFYNLERNNDVNYYGYTSYTESNHFNIAGFRFSWGQYYKKMSSFFIHTTPYLEISLYTLCFLTFPGSSCPAAESFSVITYKLITNGETFIGTAYPNGLKTTTPPNVVTPLEMDTSPVTFSEQEIREIMKQMLECDADTIQLNSNDLELCQTQLFESESQNISSNSLFCGEQYHTLAMEIGLKYEKFTDLFDNYNPQRGVNETKSIQEENEENAFLNDYLKSPSGHLLFESLQKKGLTTSKTDLKAYLKTIWFEINASSDGHWDSCGFEHVFMGEWGENDGKDVVLGLHNLIRLYFLDQRDPIFIYHGSINYTTNEQIGVANVRFNWGGYYADQTTILIHSNPYLDLSIYTWCYITSRNEECNISNEYYIITRVYAHGNKRYIKTAFPFAKY